MRFWDEQMNDFRMDDWLGWREIRRFRRLAQIFLGLA